MPRPDSQHLERLVAQEGWLRRLARELVADAALAEDVAQETWARVLARPPRALDSPRAWLARVARRVAGEERRRGRARAQREARAAAQREEPVDERAWAERVESATRLQRRLTEAVLALREPSRSTVVLRYFEGRSAASIAREAGVPESTVRNRLRRALAELRRALDREAGGDRARWLPAVVRLAGPPRTAPPAALPLLMSTSAKLLLLVPLALLAALPFVLDGGPAPPGRSAPARGEVDAAGLVTPDEAVARAQPPRASAVESPVPEPAPAAETGESPAPPLPPGTLEVVVVQAGAAPDGSLDVPLRAGHVWLGLSGVFLPRDLEGATETTVVAPLDATGTARFTAVPVGQHPVGVRPAAGGGLVQALVPVPADAGVRRVLRLGAGGLCGTVFDPLGAPVAGARLQVSGRGEHGRRVHCVLWSGPDGRYQALHLPAGPYGVGVDLSGFQNPNGAEYSALLELPAGEVLERDFGDPRGLPLWRGRVLTRAGEPADQRTLVGRRGCIHLTRQDQWSYAYHMWEEDGSFDVRLEPGTYEVALSLPGRRERQVVLEELAVPRDAPRGTAALERDLVIPGTTLSGTATSGTWIALRAEPGGRSLASLRRPADGRYRLDGVPPGSWWLDAGGPAVEVVVREGDVALTVDLD